MNAPNDRPWAGRRLHFLNGSAGVMSSVALVARSLGASVTASEDSDPFWAPYLARLAEYDIPTTVGYAAENVPDGAEVVYWTMTRSDNPELVAAKRPLLRADLVAQLAEGYRVLTVAGAHGKTTTSSMIVHILRAVGMDPSFSIGGTPRGSTESARLGTGEWFVVEADESDGSMLHYRPEVAVLTNTDNDHYRTYAHPDDVLAAFREYLGIAERQAVWAGSGAHDHEGAVLFAAESVEDGPEGVRMRWRGREVALALHGPHVAIDAAAALTACAMIGIDPDRAVGALRDFTGVGARFERMGTQRSGAEVYFDIAHHPAQVRAVLDAARAIRPARLVVAAQPIHLARTAPMAEEIGAALASADEIVVIETLPYPEPELPADYPGGTGDHVARSAAEVAGADSVHWIPRREDAKAFLDEELRADDLCLVVGGYDAEWLARSLVA